MNCVRTLKVLISSQRAVLCLQVINSCTEVWQRVCRELGWRIDESIQDAPHWKGVYLKAKLRMMQLKDQEAFETSSLIGHSARVYALYYKDGLLCTGTSTCRRHTEWYRSRMETQQCWGVCVCVFSSRF